ncbi:MAG: Sec-independent protein translocase subunit TatA/TatB [Verrucomicrobiota bacterium]
MNDCFAFLPSGQEWIWIILVILLLFGAKKLPDLARALGRSMGEFKKAKKEFDKEINETLKQDADKKDEEKKSPPQG